MDRTTPLLDHSPLIDVSQNHVVFHDEGLREGWMQAIDTTVSGRIAQNAQRDATRPVHLAKGLYLGSLSHAKDPTILSKFKFSHLVDCSTSHLHDYVTAGDVGILVNDHLEKGAKHASLFEEETKIPTYTHVSQLTDGVRRVQLEKIVRHVNSILDQPGARVLLFCLSGINRSSAVCAALLMVRHNMTLLSALSSIRDRCGPVVQMPGLQRQLLEFAIEVSQLDDVRQWPPEENDFDLEGALFDDSGSVDLGVDDADSDGTSMMADDGIDSPDLLV